MGAECSTLWHKVSPYVYKNTQILIHSCDFNLNFSTAYAWIGMISRSSPSRDGIVIRTQRYPFSHLSNITQISLFLFSRRINHPSYGGSPPDFDYQLIELSSAVNFADPQLSHVFPACWPTSEPTSGRVFVHICRCIFHGNNHLILLFFRLSFLVGEQLAQVAVSQPFYRRCAIPNLHYDFLKDRS